MPRRKKLSDELLDILFRISIVYILVLFFTWFSDKTLFLKLLLWGLAFVAVFIIVTLFVKKSKVHKQSQWHTDRDLLNYLKGIKPWEFEDYITQLYSKLGYKTERVGGGYDGGIDVIAEKNGIKYYIQCKKYITSTVGVKEIREFYGVLVGHTFQGKGIFITTNIFSSEAEYFAKDKPIELIDGQKLVRLIRQVELGYKIKSKKSKN